MAIDPRGDWVRPRLTGSGGRGLPACEQKFALDLEQGRFDRAGTTKSPQQACQPMKERKLQHGSRINTADEGPLERSIGPKVFNIPNNGLVGEPVAPSAAARSAAFVGRVDTEQVRDIPLHSFVRSPHRILKHPADLGLLAGKIR
jgi:hypothetical protein